MYKKAYFCRQFELLVAELIKRKLIYIPTYLSIGQEHIAAIISSCFPDVCIFPQHRCHSWYLSYGGSPDTLLKQLLGRIDEESNGMQGSASISIPGRMFGHSGLLGDNCAIAVGFADSRRDTTICVLGDAAVEEDYVLASLGYAATKNCPILFIVEDNNLSILTEKKVRRNWDIVNVAKGFGIAAFDIYDSRGEIISALEEYNNKPFLLNIRTERHYWHCGAGQDKPPVADRLAELKRFGDKRLAGLSEKAVHREIKELCQRLQIPYSL